MQRRARRRVLLGGVMQLVNPGAERRRAARSGAPPPRPRAGTGSCRARSSPRPARRCRRSAATVAQRRFVRLPAGRADHDVDAARGQRRQVRRHRVGEREVDRHVDVRRSRRRDAPSRRRARRRRRRRSTAVVRRQATRRAAPIRPWPTSSSAHHARCPPAPARREELLVQRGRAPSAGPLRESRT